MNETPTRERPTTGDAAPPVVRETVDIAAPPERVFRALTDPRELPAWWGGDAGPRTRDWQVDARPGGAWRATTRDRDGREGTLAGEFRVVDAPRTLEHTWQSGTDDAPSVVRWELEPREVDGVAGTRVTVTHTGPTASMTAALVRHVGLTRRLALAYRVRRAFTITM